MSNRAWEEQSLNHFRSFLKRTQAEEWVCIGRHVVVDPVTRENFDFELALGERRMALEVFPPSRKRARYHGYDGLGQAH